MTWTNRTESLYAAIEEARDALEAMAREEIARRLRVLSAAFPRHRFEFWHMNGSAGVNVSPPIFGESSIMGAYQDLRNHASYERAYQIAPDAFDLLYSELDQIDQIATEAEDEFSRYLGEVQP